jgi:hypothetical protein
VLHRHCTDVGRNPAEIMPSTHVFAGDDPPKTAESAAAFAEAGAEHLCLYFFDNSAPKLLVRTVDAVMRTVSF